MSTISAVVNTLNEEGRIARCLGSLAWADEIVVVDMHSDDETVKIARRFTDRIYQHPRTGYVEPARNFAVSMAAGDWVLVVDADEVVPPELAARLRDVATKPGGVSGVRIPRNTYNFGRTTPHISLYPDLQLRFFRRGAATYTDDIHLPPALKGEILDLPPGLGFDLEHRPDTDIGGLVERWERYATVEARAARGAGVRFDWELHLLAEPVREFRFRFFKCRGYKDGLRGLVLAMLHAFYRFSVNAKLWELSGYPSEADREIERMGGERQLLLCLARRSARQRLRKWLRWRR